MFATDYVRSYINLPADTPEGYWEGWASKVTDIEHGRMILETTRRGRDGASDAQYIVDRCASGLHFGYVLS